jgi:hypothetical protein
MQQEVNPGTITGAYPPASTAAGVRLATALAEGGQRLSAARQSEGIGSNAIAIGSAGTGTTVLACCSATRISCGTAQGGSIRYSSRSRAR